MGFITDLNRKANCHKKTQTIGRLHQHRPEAELFRNCPGEPDLSPQDAHLPGSCGKGAFRVRQPGQADRALPPGRW